MPQYPQMFRVRQSFETTRLEDAAGEVHRQLARLNLGRKVAPGESVAITAGSRGIANMAQVLRATVEHFQRLGAVPSIVPAMGSHGGGTAQGQLEVLRAFGITESLLGCPIRSSMETVVVGRTAEGIAVHFDRHALEADHVVVCNRVKPHTRFSGPIESGLMKMMLIGLGKREGALIYHRAILDYGFEQIIRSVADVVFRQCNILAGVGVVENAHDQTARIEAIPPEQFETREKELLELAKRWMPRIPFERADLLLIDQIGKNISGTGMDANVVGRKFEDHGAVEGEIPKVKLIALRGLTPQSRGNAEGMGMAELCKSSMLRETDIKATRLNAITASHLPAAMPPLDYETDREILDVAMQTIGLVEPPDCKLLWISNTLDLVEAECSAAYLEEARRRDDLEILTPPRALPLDAKGNLPRMKTLGNS